MRNICLDIGCGKKKRNGYIGLDNSKESSADIICNLENGIPIKSNSCSKIVCDNLLEHMKNLIFVMNEIWRVCAHLTEVEIIVPYYLSIGAFQDPTHVRYFTEKTFLYFNRSLPYDYGFIGKFDIVKINFIPNADFSKEFPDVPFDIARKFFINAFDTLVVTLTADKNFK